MKYDKSHSQASGTAVVSQCLLHIYSVLILSAHTQRPRTKEMFHLDERSSSNTHFLSLQTAMRVWFFQRK